MNGRKSKKELERRYVEVFKAAYESFPDGEIVANEGQERPDAIVVNSKCKIGIEVRRINAQASMRIESEVNATVNEAIRLHVGAKLPNLLVGLHFSMQATFEKSSRFKLAKLIAGLIARNIPPLGACSFVANAWNDLENFPVEIAAMDIFRMSSLKRNMWSYTPFGLIRENVLGALQLAIDRKEHSLAGYDQNCAEHWLLIVAENSSPATFYEPSDVSLSNAYRCSFKRVFFLDLFSGKVSELKVLQNQV